MVMTTSGTKNAKREPVRIIIADPCLGKAIGEEAIRHCEMGEELLVSYEDGAQIVGSGRAYYLKASDDPTGGRLTFTEHHRQTIELRKKLLADREKARATDGEVSAEASRLLSAFLQTFKGSHAIGQPRDLLS